MSYERIAIEEIRRRKKAEEEASRTLLEMYSGILKAAVAEGLLPSVDSLEGWQREILMQELSREMALEFSSIRHSWHRTQKRIQEVENAAQTPTGERHTFELSVQVEVLAGCMRRFGREIEANGGVIDYEARGFQTVLWRVNAVPEITTEGESVILAWNYGAGNERYESYPQMDKMCIRWKITPAWLGVRVDAYCALPRFIPFFYESINFAEDAAPRAQEAEDKQAEGLAKDWWAAVADETEPTAPPQPTPEGKTPEGDELPIPEGKTGPRAGTFDRVREAHRLLKLAEEQGKSRTWAFQQARTDSRTYYQWCEQANGEPPLALE